MNTVNHPVFDQILTVLRNKDSDISQFRAAAEIAGIVLAVNATQHLATKEIQITTPLTECTGWALAREIVLVAVLRAGLSLLEPFLKLLPDAAIGHIGIRRNEHSAAPERYSLHLPPLVNRSVFLLDPMLATGGSACESIKMLLEAGAEPRINLVSLIAAPEGIRRVQSEFPQIELTVGVVDERLNERFFIVPGLGDFGDRLYGT
jgi:uracil phosphoribosyltransferase